MLRKLAMLFAIFTAPRCLLAGRRFLRTGTEFDYWRWEYYDDGPTRTAQIIMHKDRLIAHYCAEAYRLREELALWKR